LGCVDGAGGGISVELGGARLQLLVAAGSVALGLG